MRRHYRIVAALALILAGCGSPSRAGTVPSQAISRPTAVRPTPATMIDEAGPPPITLTNPSPADLTVSLYVSMGGYDASTSDGTEVAISLLKAGRSVRILAPEQMTCNGIPVPQAGNTFDLRVPTQTIAGQQVTCLYVLGRTSSTMTFILPPAQTILAPTDGARLARNRRTTVSFRVGGRSTMFYVIALGPDRKAWAYPPVGASSVTLDTSAFSAGSGSIDLNQEFALPVRAPAFHAASGSGGGVQQITVTWI